MITRALRYLKQAEEKRNEPTEFSLPCKKYVLYFRNFLQVRYPNVIPSGEVPNARLATDPAALTGTTGTGE
eukprot:3156346-Pyramimonas_sp.AAC.1